ncbi:MAG: hypothetical protein CL920_15860 [Deltaproteobacteria bacterium]|nr:hypothetical protein [Deltaproteobacteria bacterium]
MVGRRSMFGPLERAETVPERIAAILRRAILCDELGVNERLPSEKALSSQFETNRVSLRQALQILKADGLIEGGQGRPWRVADYRANPGLHLLPYLFEAKGISEETVRVIEDFLAIRTPVLAEVLELAVQRMTDEQLEALREALQRLQSLADEDSSTEALFLADLDWFECLLAASNSLLFRSVYQPLSSVYRQFSSAISMFWTAPDGYPARLWSIYSEVEARNAAQAKTLLVEYLNEESERLHTWISMVSHTLEGGAFSGTSAEMMGALASLQSMSVNEGDSHGTGS